MAANEQPAAQDQRNDEFVHPPITDADVCHTASAKLSPSIGDGGESLSTARPTPTAATAPPRWRNYEFDLGGYREAVEEQQRLLLVATEASKKLDAANEIVKEYEDKLRRAMENAMGECRVYAKERAGVQ